MSAGKFLDPKNDLAFKRIFGTEGNKDILIHFLNDIFGRQTNPIEDVIFLKTFQNAEIASKRESIVDVLCRDTQGNRFIIEMQVVHEPSFIKRAQYYAAKAYINQRGINDDYKDLKDVTFLAITNFTLFKDKEEYLSHHHIMDTKTLTRDLKDISFSFLELPKFHKTKDQLKTMTEKWAYFFKEAEDTKESDLATIIGSDMIVERAFDELNRFDWDESTLLEYDSVEMKRWSNKAILEGAFDDGMAAGEEKAAIRIAKALLAQGVDAKAIQAATGLPLAEIESC